MDNNSEDISFYKKRANEMAQYKRKFHELEKDQYIQSENFKCYEIDHQNKIDNLMSVNESLGKQNMKLREMVNEQQEKNKLLSKENTQCKKDIVIANFDKDKNDKIIQELREKLNKDNKINAIKTLTDFVERQKKELKEKNELVDTLGSEIKRNEQIIDILRKENTQCKKDIVIANFDKDKNARIIEELHKDDKQDIIKNLNLQLQIAKKESKAQKDEITNLTNKLTEMDSNHSNTIKQLTKWFRNKLKETKHQQPIVID